MLTFHRRWVSVTVTGAIVAVLLFSGFYAWAASGAATGAVGSSGAPANNAGPAPTASATPAPRLHGGGPTRAVLGERGRPNLPGLAPPAARTPAAAVHLAGGGGLPKTAWTTSLVNGSVSVGDVVGAIGIEPLGVAYDPSRGELFVADWASDTVTVLGASNGTVLATVPVGTGPVALAYASASGEVFVANQFSNDVSILSDATNSLVTTVDVGVAPSAIAYDPARAELFVANNGSGNVSVLSATSGASLASITVGSHPSGVAYDAVLGGVAVSNWASNSVSLVSDVTDTVLATVGVGAGPAGLAIVPSNGTVLVAASGAGEVDLVSVANDSFAGSVPVGLGPSAIAWDPTTAVAYVVAGGSDNVSLVSVATLAVVGTTAVGVLPEGIAYDAAQGELFVANAYSNNVSALADRNGSVVASYPLGAFPMGLAYDGTQHAVYVASADANVLSAIADSNDVPRPVAGLGLGADGVAYDSARGELFVANNLSDTVSVVSATSGSVVASIPVGVGPAAVAYDPAKGEVFVANENNTSDSVSVISDATNTVVATVPVGDGPIALAYDPAKGEVFVANNGSGTVSVISDATDHVVATITVGLYPDGVAYDNGTSQLFVANGGSDTVSVLSDVSNTVTKTVTVGFFPAGLAYDSGQHEVYVADELSNNVSVIADGSDTVLATVPVGLTPTAVAYDPATAEVFVANPDSGTVSVLTDGTARAFSAQLTVKTTDSTGAPLAGATVRVDGQTAVTGAGGSTEFLLPNGSYVVNATESGYLSANASVSVAGTGSVALTLGFPYHYLGVIPPADLNITATDAGVQVALRGLFAASPADVYFDWKHVGILAAGAGWTDFLTTALPSLIVVGAQHGSSDYPNAYYARPTTLPGAGCGAVPATSGIGLPITVNPDPPVYGSPTLVTVGLHNSCPYALSIQELIVEYADFNIGGAVFNPIGTFHNISLPVNASDNLSLLWNTTFNAAEYGYHHCLRIQIIYGSPVPPQGNFISGLHNLDIEPNTVAGHAGSVDFTVRNPDAMTEPVEIVVVSAMPAGWSTSVVLNGEPEAASPFYVTLDAGQQVSGTLTIQPSGHTPGNGTVQIQEYIGSELIGGLEKKLQELPPGKFPVDFTESGLPSGVAWSVTFNGQTLSTHGPTIYANATNASYPFTVTPPTGYNAKPLSGTVDVNGAAVTQKVQFALPGGVYCGEISAPLIASGSVPIPFGSDDSPVSIEFDGGVSLTPTLSVCLGTKTVLGFIPEPTFLNITESLDESASASITASGTASFNDLDDPDEFGDFQLGCYPIGPVPVCLSAAIDLGIAADFTASVSVSMTQGIHLQASQNYSFETDRWTSVPVQETCSGAGESLAYGCVSFSAGASIAGSLEMRIGPKIDISAAHLVGVSFWPYVGVNLSAGASTSPGTPAPCGSDSFGWPPIEPWVAACGLLGVVVSGNVLDIFDLGSIDWTILDQPLGSSVAVCAAGGYPCASSLDLTPGEEVNLEAYAPLTGVWFNWTSSCFGGTVEGANLAFTAPTTVGATCSIDVTTGLPLDIPLLDLSEETVSVKVVPTAPVTFKEVGLPASASWSVTAGPAGQTQSTTGKSLTFTEPEGTVLYAVTGPNGYGSALTSPATAGSPLNVTGPTTVSVKFGRVLSLVFREVGLPVGDRWNVSFGSRVAGGPATESGSTTKSSQSFSVVADPYRWTVHSVSNEYKPAKTHGNAGVSKGTKTVKLRFKEIVGKVTFAEKGLKGHTHWSVSIGGRAPVNGTRSSIAIPLPNGTYHYTIASSNLNYTTDQQTGTVHVVAPAKVKISVTFTGPGGAAPAAHGARGAAGSPWASLASVLERLGEARRTSSP